LDQLFGVGNGFSGVERHVAENGVEPDDAGVAKTPAGFGASFDFLHLRVFQAEHFADFGAQQSIAGLGGVLGDDEALDGEGEFVTGRFCSRGRR